MSIWDIKAALLDSKVAFSDRMGIVVSEQLIGKDVGRKGEGGCKFG
jgi:hypothetical protein